MTVVGLRSLGAAMTDVTPLANGHVSEEQLACWGAHLLMMIFQSEDAQESIKELMLSANAAARLSELVEKVLSS
jgi:hypothetical protein